MQEQNHLAFRAPLLASLVFTVSMAGCALNAPPQAANSRVYSSQTLQKGRPFAEPLRRLPEMPKQNEQEPAEPNRVRMNPKTQENSQNQNPHGQNPIASSSQEIKRRFRKRQNAV